MPHRSHRSESNSNLSKTLHNLDGKNYGAYKSLRGTHNIGDDITLVVDRVQSDPYAPPSLMRIIVDRKWAGIPEHYLQDREGIIATSDFLTRMFAQAAADAKRINIGRLGQTVLERTSIKFGKHTIEARITVAMPANGRRIRGREAAHLLTVSLPEIVEQSLVFKNLDETALGAHVALLRDQEAVRKQLTERKFIAFIGNGAILPRLSGDSDLPLNEGAIPFESPKSLEATFELPSGRTITGMAIPEGITVIIGGGFHGKSTLLRAIEHGVYPHIAGDGREWVITRTDATSIRAEDGRSVTGVDISAFINNLPSGADTKNFNTPNASGSTSQAANVVEAIEAGATAFLIDEDTSATNFMIRDELMQQLIPANKEPITPFVQRVRPLFTDLGVSTILVAGGSGAFFGVADNVIAMNAYVPSDVTTQAHQLAGTTTPKDAASISMFESRIPLSLDAPGKTKPAKALGLSEIRYRKETIQLSALTQLIDAAQTAGLARALDSIAEMCDGGTLRELVDDLCADMDDFGIEILAPQHPHPGLYARPRRHEIMAAVNRYRQLKLEPPRQ